MDELFGLSMTTAMYVLLVIFGIFAFLVGLIFIRNRIAFLMGVRNIPRRTAQTVLIIVGLMLSTLIITAAFTTGDTVDYSITKQTYDLLGHADVVLDAEVGTAGPAPREGTADDMIAPEDYQALIQASEDSPNIDGVVGMLFEPVPVINSATSLSEPDVYFVGVDAEQMDALPDLRDVSTDQVYNVKDLGSGEVYLNESAADELSAGAGDTLITFIEGQPHEVTVRAVLKDAGASGAIDSTSPEGMVASLETLQGLFQTDDLRFVLVSATGDVRPSEVTLAAAEADVAQIIRQDGLRMEISDTKRDLVKEAEEIGNFMTTFFLLLGLFSIGAGMLLIVMIFVMLAAERKPEMGMARAVGMKRLHLVEMFIAEGSGYNLGSAFVGVAIGVAVAFALTMAASAVFSAFGLSFTPHATLRTLIISFCLGSVLTFLTVTFSSWRVSTLNITAAIRDTPDNITANPEDGTFRGYARSLLNAVVVILNIPLGALLFVLRGSDFALPNEERTDKRMAWFPLPEGILGFPLVQVGIVLAGFQQYPTWPFYSMTLATTSFAVGALFSLSLLIVLGVLCAMVSLTYVLAIGMVRLLRNHRPVELPTWLMFLAAIVPIPLLAPVVMTLQHPRDKITWAPGLWTIAIVIGVILAWLGMNEDSAFPFGLGVSLILGGGAVVGTYFGAPGRPTYTAMGLLLLLFWGLAAGNRLEPVFGDLNGDIEMFFLSGVAMVSASTFVLIYNADIFLAFAERVGGAFGSILPSLRTAIAYPMANRFRTGMTLSMISLVVFAITTMSTMNLNYDKLFLRDESRGGWDVQVIENPNNPFPTLSETLRESDAGNVADEIRAEGAVYVAGFDSATEVSSDGEEFVDYMVRGVSDGFVDNGSVPLDMKAVGYETDAEIWQALKTQDDVAVIDRFTVEQGFGPAEFTLEGVDISATVFDPVPITVRDSGTGLSRQVQIIGIISFGASGNFTGVYLGEDAFLETFGEPELAVHYAAVVDPGAAEEVADGIEAALVTTGAQAKSLQEIANENNALSRNFLYLMQAFMGLGLVVGIAAIGVISFRTVVERRQQIGMLRAIGYKRSQVALSFMLESGFVTFLGVLSGVGLGIWLAYFLVTGDDFPGGGGDFYVPWVQIGILAFLTIAASFLMTWIPARQAASVPTAEALRYE